MSTDALVEEHDPAGDPIRRRTGAARRVSKCLLWLSVVLWLVFAGWRLFGAEANWFVVVAMAFAPFMMFAGVVLLLWALWLRAGVAFTGALLSIMALVAVIVPRAIGVESPAADGSALTVMTVNLRIGGGDAERVVSLVDRYDVDVLAVQELTDESLAALERERLSARLPHQEYVTAEDASGSGVFSAVPMTVRDPVPGLFFMPTVRLALPDEDEVLFTSVHPMAPLGPSSMSAWNEDLRSLPAAERDGPIRILAGDFNASLDHRILRDLIDTGYVDAADATGNGLTGTWRPVGGWSGLVMPVALDRVLVDDRVAVRSFAIHHVEGSDHRVVVADVRLP
ncbi:MAG TPA: endonuclease/exonuclease/phosphatase family protein [Candidatus Stackebrandtia excrementipullorum]|nr:endonuclease/exonuclease/phosphatase family protein [Candidatus Stackebrandtia excrementipullorum]